MYYIKYTMLYVYKYIVLWAFKYIVLYAFKYNLLNHFKYILQIYILSVNCLQICFVCITNTREHVLEIPGKSRSSDQHVLRQAAGPTGEGRCLF